MTFNSHTRENSVKNQYLYNAGSELQDDLDLGVYETYYRMLDPATGRWWQVDPMVDEMYSWSPYNYSFNNPIRFNDPKGDYPDCCGDALDFVAGFAAAAVDNATGGLVNLRDNYSPTNAAKYNEGQDVGDVGSMIVGAYLTVDGSLNVAVGTTGLAASAVAETATGGIATPVAVPAAAVSGAIALKGTIEVAAGSMMLSQGSSNLKNQKGRVQENKPVSTKKDRIKAESNLERSQNQLEGIEKAQDSAKKLAKEGKQNKINSTKKSEQNLKTELKRIKTRDDID